MPHSTGLRACAAACALSGAAACATEGGGNSYPMGVETNGVGMMLPEGAHVFLYGTHYEASHFKDEAGHDNPRLALFRVRSDAVAARLSYVWPGVHLLGASVETRVVQAVASVDLALGIARPAPAPPLDRGGTRTGLADTALSPLILGWHSPAYHQTVGIDSHLKTGTYDVAEPVNTGRNHWQLAPFYAFTGFPAKAVDLNGKLRWAVNSRNEATGYRSGREMSFEFSAGYRQSPSLAFGLNGYVYRQTSDDVQNGMPVNGNGNRGRVNTLGPYVNIGLAPRWGLIVKVQRDFGVRNRPEGTRVWVQTKVPL